MAKVSTHRASATTSITIDVPPTVSLRDIEVGKASVVLQFPGLNTNSCGLAPFDSANSKYLSEAPAYLQRAP